MPMHYEPLAEVQGGMHLRDTWEMRFLMLVRAGLAFFVAAVVLPAPVYGGFALFRAFEDGPHYDSQTLIAAAILVVGASVVLIACRYGQDRLVRAIRPLEPIYGEIATGAVVVRNPSFREEARAAREEQNNG
ncbi:hypothetical protein NY551_18940 [Curtobacterium flaccumfaciens pv. oortii]|uniref:hypothetical protein n=1 Tax=Curtobacterium flaccumfaciens TaxID=2035 RepID=UPI002659150F|nr:hypothetical protein [Curtobacterium flaccumfaciens]MCS5524817.1 hypothetical protein [Curtobacterium flaccumfaciens pv. oortii]